MIGLMMFMLLVFVAVLCMLAITLKVQASLRKQNYISGVRYGKVVQQLQDKHELHRFGFGQFFKRQYGELSIFSISMNTIGMFPIMLLLFAPMVMQGGLVNSLFVYSGVGLLFIVIVALIGQYLSSQPTAGGLYHVALRRGGAWLGAIVGGLQLVAQVAMLLGYSYGVVYFLKLLAGHKLIWLEQMSVFTMVMGIVILVMGVIGLLKSNYSPLFHYLSIIIQGLGVIVLFIVVYRAMQGDIYNGMHLFQLETNVNGWFPASSELTPMHIGFMVALACRFFIGGDASSQAAEETIEPKVRTAWSALLSTCYSYMVGMILMLVLAIVYMNLGIQANGAAGEQWFMILAERTPQLGVGLMLLALLSCWFSGSTLLHVSARTLMAMARDGIIPLKQTLSKISYSKQSPQHAVIGVQVLACMMLLVLYMIGSTEFFIVSSLISFISYAVIYVLLLYGVPLDQKTTLWKLEEWDKPIRLLSILVLIALVSAAGSSLTAYELAIIILPTLAVLIYAVIANGFTTKLLQYDVTSSRDLFERERELPLQ
ncbi:APC family permease [Paenibacillus camelliae]|uniref:APC family permease n=1 Tax=Paenibacillus camelliae TaxID=512410 RepID=UPI00203C1AEC|nr:amino acid permease [Paenibacillus camelliae]MCM3631759.1 amino acid permease [Paenibacillus camelliae]